MNKFKIGDRVRVRLDLSRNEYNGNFLTAGKVGTVTHTWSDHMTNVAFDDGSSTQCFDCRFELIVSIEETISLLKEKGYAIEPPKPKRTGKVVIYRWTSYNDKINCVEKEVWDKNFNYGPKRTDLELIAIVDWTEGDGLDEQDEMGGFNHF